jgi:peptidoglycan hydrolase CwlO-like protein
MPKDPVLVKLEEHDKQFETIIKKLTKHDQQFDLLTREILDHDKKFNQADSNIKDYKNEILTAVDRLSVQFKRFDEERVFYFRII